MRDRNYLDKLPECNADLEWALYECFLMARRGKSRTVDEFNYDAFWKENQEQLVRDIIERKWRPSSSKAFVTHDPVDREIFAAQFRDRIIHHLLYAITAPWWDKRFIYDSYSCRKGKGTDFGVERMQSMMVAALTGGTPPNNRAERRRPKAYVLKGDLSGYFMSMRRKTLYRKVLWGLKKQFPEGGWLFELARYLWKEVIFNDPCLNVRMVGSLKEWDCLPRNKTLIYQPKGQGIVIGNLTSQLLSNIMLNEFDWFVKKGLGFSWYGRYVDDFFIIVREADFERAKHAMMHALPEYLRGMGLKMHPKKLYIQEVRHGCPFLGKKVTPYVILPGKRYLKRMRRAFRGFVEGATGYETMQSYVGMAKHMAAYQAMKKVISELENEILKEA